MQKQATLKEGSLFLLFVLVFGLWSLHRGQDVGWDLRNYHFYNAYAFLYHRLWWDIAPAQMQTWLNPFLDLFHYFLIVNFNPHITAFVMGGLSGVTAFLVYQISLLLFQNKFCAFWVILVAFTGVMNSADIGVINNDTETTLFIMGAIYLCLTEKWLIAGLLIGLITGLKFTAAPFAVAMLLGVVWLNWRSPKPILIFLVASAMGFALGAGPWMLTLYHHTQNPLFPYFNNIFHSPYAQNMNYADTRFHPHSIWGYLFYPFLLMDKHYPICELSMRDPRLGVCYVLAIVFFVFRDRKKPIALSWQFIFILTAVAYLLWLKIFTIYWYAASLEIMATLCIVCFVGPNRKTLLAVLGVLIVVTTYHIQPHGGHVTFSKKYFELEGKGNVLPKKALVLLIGGDPMAYVIPLFPQSDRFVGIQNNFMNPNNQNLTQEEAKHVIKYYSGPLYSLQLTSKKRTPGCHSFKTNALDEFTLCPLKRQ